MLRAGYGMKISWQDQDALISIGRMRDSFEIDSGIHAGFKQQVNFWNVTRRDWDNDSESGGMVR